MKFTKMHGCGNDYVYVNLFEEQIGDPAKVSIAVSDRHFGIGSDGLITIGPSEIAYFRMRIYNADGSEAEMCGNGIRCVSKFVYDKGLTDKKQISIVSAGKVKYLDLTVENGKVVMVIDLVVAGKKSSYQLLVFSSKYKEIADYIINEMDRGVTLLKAQGWFTKKDKDVLLILISQKQLPVLSRYIKILIPRGGDQIQVGAAVATNVNDVNNSFNASVTGSTVKVNGTDGVSVKADSKTVMVALAAGSSVSVSSGGLVTVDVAGSGVANTINNDTIAKVENSTIAAPKLAVDASTNSTLVCVAGQLSAAITENYGGVAGLTWAQNSFDNSTVQMRFLSACSASPTIYSSLLKTKH